MHISKRLLALLTGLFISTQAFSATPWHFVGAPDFTGNKSVGASSLTTYSMAVATDGTPYLTVLYQFGQEANFKLATLKYSATTHQWQTFATLDTDSIGNIAMAVNPDGVPFIAHIGAGKQIEVKKYDSQSQQWVSLGNVAGAPPLFDIGLKIAFDPKGAPYVAYQRDNRSIVVMHLTGTGWRQVHQTLSASGETVGKPEMAINKAGKIYIAFMSLTKQQEHLHVMTLANATWQPVAADSLPVLHGWLSETDPVSLALDPNGNPTLAYVDSTYLRAASVIRLSDAGWVPVGKPNFTPSETVAINLAIDQQSTPYIAYTYIGATHILPGLMKFDGTAWIQNDALLPTFTDNFLLPVLKASATNQVYLADARCTDDTYNTCWMNVLNNGS